MFTEAITKAISRSCPAMSILINKVAAAIPVYKREAGEDIARIYGRNQSERASLAIMADNGTGAFLLSHSRC